MGSSLEFGLSKKNWLPTNHLSQMAFSYGDNPIGGLLFLINVLIYLKVLSLTILGSLFMCLYDMHACHGLTMVFANIYFISFKVIPWLWCMQRK